MNGHGKYKGVEGLARLGYAARGLVYIVVGWFAVVAAQGRGSPTDTKGALASMLTQPLGTVLLAVVTLGLVAYALWRITEAVLDVDHRGRDTKALAIRAGHVVSGIAHIALAVFAVGLLMAGVGGGESGDSSAKDWTAWLMSWPFGRWLVAGVGVAIAAASIAHFAKAWNAGFCQHLRVTPQARRFVEPLGRAGFAAKGVVFALVGLFFLTAAWQIDPSESGGLGQALRTLQEQPYGPWLLGIVAVGLLAFGLFSFAQAVYRRIDIDGAERQARRVIA